MAKRRKIKTKICMMTLLGTALQVHADPVGVIGGDLNTDNAAYGAILTDEVGAFTSISGLPNDARIYSVSINGLGTSFLAGRAENEGGNYEGYFAFVASDGSITVSDRIPPADPDNDDLYLYSGAINNSGNGFVGGIDNGNEEGYVAQISSDGTVNAISLPGEGDITPAGIFSVDLNNSGVGLVGGEGASGGNIFAYAALVQENGSATFISELDLGTIGKTNGVSINDSGKGILGGYYYTGTSNFLAGFVSSEGVFTPFYDEATPGVLRAAAINDSGLGLIAGEDGEDNLYAALVSADGTLTSLIESPPAGTIYSAALNSSGEGILGGEHAVGEGDFAMYGARVLPNGTISTFEFSTVDGSSLTSVAINEAGVGLVGGSDSEGAGYVALIAPNGTITELDLSALNADSIESVALFGSFVPSSGGGVTPTSVNGSNSSVSVQFASASALQTRFIEKNKVWGNLGGGNSNDTALNDQLLVYNRWKKGQKEPDDFSDIAPGRIGSKEAPNSIWAKPFANFLRVDADGEIPQYDNDTWGALLGYDRQEERYLVGVAGGYAYNSTRFSQNVGSGTVHQGMLSVYGASYWKNFWIGAALWGGRYFLESTRTTLSSINSVGKTHGWIFSPYIEMASPWALDKNELYYIEPFASATWVKNWQDGYTETGASGLNLIMPGLSTNVWQLEAGLRFYEKFIFSWGDFRLEEKLSYMNQNPSDNASVQTSFVGAASTFPVAIASSKVQNLVSGQIVGTFVPAKIYLPCGGFSCEISANGGYQSYFVNLFIAERF